MASQKMQRRIRKAFDWIDRETKFWENYIVRTDFSKPGASTRDQVADRIRRGTIERHQLQVFHADAVAGMPDAELLARGLGDLESYKQWRRGSAARHVPLPGTCPMCRDTGYQPVADAYGEYDGVDLCNCPAGRRVQAAAQASRATMQPIDDRLF